MTYRTPNPYFQKCQASMIEWMTEEAMVTFGFGEPWNVHDAFAMNVWLAAMAFGRVELAERDDEEWLTAEWECR